MKAYIKLISAIMVLFAVSVAFSSCKDNGEPTPSQSYVYHPSDESSSASEQASDNSPKTIKVDTSWRKNYTVTYTYYNSQQSTEKINVREKRSSSCFSAEDTVSGDTLYYKANGGDVDSYVIVPHEDEQLHSTIKGKTLDDLSSTFMKLTEVDSDLPLLTNVLYMYDETVGGRPCEKYIQRAYSSGQVTESVYVWVDKEFGFAMKGEVYDGETKLSASWEVVSFEAGNNSDEDVAIDLSGYNIREE